MLYINVKVIFVTGLLELSHFTRYLVVFLDFLDGGVSFTLYISLMVTK